MRKRIIIFISLVVALAAGWWLADRALKARGYAGAGALLGQTFTNYPKSFDAQPLRLTIDVDEQDHRQLLKVVEQARERGVIMPEGNNYVPARIMHGGRSSKAKIRIKGKLTDHVKGDKWSFRILGRKGGGFLGMQRFSLQHPGTRNYLYEWLYHRIMQREDVIALQYGLVDVALNDKELGLYAYEEHFGPELLQRNGRLQGPIVRFDPGLYWIQRLNEMKGLRAYESYAQYQAAALDAYGSGEVLKDEQSKEQFERAIEKMERFRRAELPASTVFNAELIAIRHAVIDLIGGHHSMDWSDVKFYFNPVQGMFEPVAYESFSVHPLKQLAGSHKFLGRSRSFRELHQALFNDEEVFRAYVRNLERVSSEQYLDGLFTDLAQPIDSMSAILYSEFPYKELDRSLYYKNAATIRRMLDIPEGAHAYMRQDRDSIHFTFVPVSDLPVEVKSIEAGDHSLDISAPIILPARPGARPGAPTTISVAAPADLKKQDLQFTWSVLGASTTRRSKILPFAFRWEPVQGAADPSDLSALASIIIVDTTTHTATFTPGDHVMDHDVTFPKNMKVVARAPLRINLTNGAVIRFQGPVDIQGHEEGPIMIEADDAGPQVVIHTEKGRSAIRNTHFIGLGLDDRSAVIIHRSNVTMDNCLFQVAANSTTLAAGASQVVLDRCAFVGGRDQLDAELGYVELNECSFTQAGDDAITIRGGHIEMKDVTIQQIGGVALKLEEQASMIARTTVINDAKKGVELSQGSTGEMERLHLNGLKVGLEVDKADILHGAPNLQVIDAQFDAVEKESQCGNGSTLLINGKARSAVATGT